MKNKENNAFLHQEKEEIKPSQVEINLLSESLKHTQNEIKETHRYLSKLGLPTNGAEGSGKRQTLSLTQRLSYLSAPSESTKQTQDEM